MLTPSCCDRLTLRIVLLKVSPLVARLISVPDDLSLEELHNVVQLVFGWRGQAFYNFRIHGQAISTGSLQHQEVNDRLVGFCQYGRASR